MGKKKQTETDSDNPEATPPPAEGESLAEPEKDHAYKKLRRAMGKEVGERSVDIAKSIVDSTVKGNSNSARILVGLVDKRPKTKSELKKLKKTALEGLPLKSTAIDLAAEPQWQDDEHGHAAPAAAERRKGKEKDEAHQES
jgi:hypothetical protein